MVQTDRQIVDGNIVRRMRFACSIIKATDTRSECVIQYLLLFPGNDGYPATTVKRMRLKVTLIRTLPVLLTVCLSLH